MPWDELPAGDFSPRWKVAADPPREAPPGAPEHQSVRSGRKSLPPLVWGRAMREPLETAVRVAGTDAPVLLLGESGTGKELLSRWIHEHSARRSGPFVAINCAAVPEPLLESEMFGHERGAFTGAVRRRIGRFERASGGTLLLDEIADMRPSLQATILRAVERGEIERIGSHTTTPVDVRLIAATNRDLREEIATGRFREDLYYRLAVVVIELPPLRARGDDVGSLAEHHLLELAQSYGLARPRLAPETVRALCAYSWPGNVRELRNAIHRAVLLAGGGVIRPEHLPADILHGGPAGEEHRAEPPAEAAAERRTSDGPLLPLIEVERRHIERIVAAAGGNYARAAEILGIHRNTLRRKLRAHPRDP